MLFQLINSLVNNFTVLTVNSFFRPKFIVSILGRTDCFRNNYQAIGLDPNFIASSGVVKRIDLIPVASVVIVTNDYQIVATVYFNTIAIW